ncbi:hypothetical protein C4565_06290 [Candidatus Parcubacteria bacterium]|jgi:hypothetical protein|nr:MAG: hypothetical protein C4565_06290 [Candidatus Parcubacteria bacterium]
MVVRKNVRNALLVLCTVIFVIGGTYAIFTMQGLVFDPSSFEITKSGSIYIHFTPTNAVLSVNGKPYLKKQSIFGGGILISNLIPKTYTISIAKDEYTPWTKELEVVPGKVSVAARITLWKNIDFQKEGSSTIKSFYHTGEGFIFETPTSSLIFNDKIINGNSVEAHNDNTQYVITKTKQGNLFLIDLTKPDIVRDFRILFSTVMQTQETIDSTKIEKTAFHPFSKNKLIVETQQDMYIYDLKKNTIDPVNTEGIPKNWNMGSSELFIINDKGDLVIKNLIVGSKYVYPIEASSTQDIVPSNDGNYIFITTKKKSLFLFDREEQASKKIGENILFTSISPDNTRALYIDNKNNVYILYLDDYEGDSIKTKGTIEKLSVPKGTDLKSFTWIPAEENYAMVRVGKTIRIMELDMREPHNAATIAKDITYAQLIGKNLFAINSDGEFLMGSIEE